MAGVGTMLDERSYQQGNITGAAITSHIQATVRNEITPLLNAVRALTTAPEPATRAPDLSGGQQALLRDFVLPAGWTPPANLNIRLGWIQWWLGGAANVPPLRRITHHHLNSKKSRKILDEWHCVFSRMEGYLRSQNKFVSAPTAPQVAEMFSDALPYIVSHGSKRGRHEQLHISTVAKKLRKK